MESNSKAFCDLSAKKGAVAYLNGSNLKGLPNFSKSSVKQGTESTLKDRNMSARFGKGEIPKFDAVFGDFGHSTCQTKHLNANEQDEVTSFRPKGQGTDQFGSEQFSNFKK